MAVARSPETKTRRSSGSVSGLGWLVIVAGIAAMSYMAIRTMTAKQQAAFALDAGNSDVAVPQLLVPPIPSSVLSARSDAGKGEPARLDIVMRVDGVAVSFDGAAACRRGRQNLVGRSTNGAAGTFDEMALATCLRTLFDEHPSRSVVAFISRAGIAVPADHVEELRRTIEGLGVKDIVVSHPTATTP